MKKKSSTFLRVLNYASPYKLKLILAIFCGLIYVASTILIPILTGFALDNIVGFNNVDFNKVLMYVLLILVLLIVGNIFQWIMNYLTGIVTYRMVCDLRKEAMDLILNVELKTIDNYSQGDIVTRVITDIDNVSDGLVQGFRQFLTGILTIVSTLIIMFILCYPLALGVLILTPLSMLVASFIAKGSSKSVREQSSLKGKLGGVCNEYLSNQKTVILFSHEEEALEKFDVYNKELNKVGFKAQFYAALINPSTRFVNALIYALVATCGALIVVNPKVFNLGLTVGTLYSFLTYASNYTKPFNEISAVVAELQNSLASAKRVFELLDEKRLSSDVNGVVVNNTKGAVKVENVYFSYVPEQKLIENFNLDVKPGMKVAIVGPTGCGKTTLINLFMRFYEVNQGNIYIDGVSIKDMKRSSLRDVFGMVLQDTWMFKGTVKENIAYAKKDASDEEIIEAAKKAHAHNFIIKLPQGYDTIISDDEGLSQGQKQLLCIARLMLKKPSVLILDEATSSIDTRTELLIQKGFNEIMKGRTSFIIAHRLSTIEDADIILVLKDGKIIETGNHKELLAKKGFYASLYESQFQIV